MRAQEEEGKELELSDFNKEVVECFKDFIKYNVNLVHLNLEKTGLSEPAIKYIAALLRKSQALRCIHLCGNEGLSPELIEWVRERVHAKPANPETHIRSHSAVSRNTQNKAGSAIKGGLMKVNRGFSLKKMTVEDEKEEW